MLASVKYFSFKTPRVFSLFQINFF